MAEHGQPAGEGKGSLLPSARAIAWPIRELVLGVRDTWSPEMREIRERKRITQLNRIGDVRYIATITLRLTMIFEGVNVLMALPQLISGKIPWHLAWSANARGIILLGVTSVIVGAVSASRDIVKLSEKYPDEVHPPR